MEGSEGLVLVPAESSMKLLQVEKVGCAAAAQEDPWDMGVSIGLPQWLDGLWNIPMISNLKWRWGPPIYGKPHTNYRFMINQKPIKPLIFFVGL